MIGDSSPEQMIAIAAVLFLGIGIHEYAHCKMADLAGDPTPRFYGRVTLDLTKHFELMGTMMIILASVVGFGIGWGKPAPMDPRKMKNPRWDFFAAVIAGPLSNLIQAGVYAIILRILILAAPSTLQVPIVGVFLLYGVLMNLALCFFNLIPFGPLDGQWLLGLLMPEPQRIRWFQFNRQVGMIGLFGIIMISSMMSRSGGPDLLGLILKRPVGLCFQYFTGIPSPI